MESFDKLAWRIRGVVKAPSTGGLIDRIRRRFAVFALRHLQSLAGFSIPTSVDFVSPPVFPHGLNGIFISFAAKIGKNCVIFHQVTIGSNTLVDSKRYGSPTIGDDVYIGAGAKIIGKITIGDRVRIGANAVVTQDVPANSTVLGHNDVRLSSAPRDNRFVPMSLEK